MNHPDLNNLRLFLKDTIFFMVDEGNGCFASMTEYADSYVEEVAIANTFFVNELIARSHYMTDNPEASLTITDDGPRLDEYHEVLFKIGRQS